MSLPLIIDIIVAVLLVITIAYATVLNKRLGNLRRDRSELEKLAVSFHTSTERADESIGRLKSSVANLQEQMGKAESLRDDLIFLTERGSSAADRLENAVRLSRGDAPVNTATPTTKSPPSAEKPEPDFSNPIEQEALRRSELTASSEDSVEAEPVSEAERELLKALRSAS